MTGRRFKRVLNRVSSCLQDFSPPQHQKKRDFRISHTLKPVV
nr:MAG TPA: hypothetical protein [Caudoviricetes sp.]